MVCSDYLLVYIVSAEHDAVAPCEFLVVGQLSKATETLLKHLSGSRYARNFFWDSGMLTVIVPVSLVIRSVLSE